MGKCKQCTKEFYCESCTDKIFPKASRQQTVAQIDQGNRAFWNLYNNKPYAGTTTDLKPEPDIWEKYGIKKKRTFSGGIPSGLRISCFDEIAENMFYTTGAEEPKQIIRERLVERIEYYDRYGEPKELNFD